MALFESWPRAVVFVGSLWVSRKQPATHQPVVSRRVLLVVIVGDGRFVVLAFVSSAIEWHRRSCRGKKRLKLLFLGLYPPARV